MATLFHLACDHPDMAKDEVLTVSCKKGGRGSMECSFREFGPDLILLETPFAVTAKRLALTREVYSLLFVCQTIDLLNMVGSTPWKRHCKPPICVRYPGDRAKERQMAGIILSSLVNPSVDLIHPKTLIQFFDRAGSVLCGVLKFKNTQDFESRKSHHLPAPHPSSMHPRLARWFVNRTGIQKGTLIDPFCGAGGILLEAGLMGLSCKGFDIEQSMINRARANLLEWKIKAVLERKDALTISRPMRFVASDLPYGRATKARDINGLYQGFLRVLERHLTERAVIGYPDFVDLISMVDLKKLRIAGNYEYYLHKSLTKKIIILEAIIQKSYTAIPSSSIVCGRNPCLPRSYSSGV